MRAGDRSILALGAACLGACAGLAGIEDLSLTGDASTVIDAGGDVVVDSTSDTSGGSSGGGSSGDGSGSGSGNGSGSGSGSSSGSGSGSGSSSGGSSSGSGGSPDAGTYCTGSYLLCDTFEEGLDTSVWTVLGPNGTGTSIVVDTSQHHSGTHALHVSLPAATASGPQSYLSSEVQETQTFPSNGPLYFRAYFMLSNYTMQNTGVMTPFGSIAGQGGWAFESDGTLFAGVSNSGTPNDYSAYTTSQIPLMQWTCIELETDPSMAPLGFQQLGWGSPLVWLSGSDGTADLTSLASLNVGLDLGGPSNPVQLWIDDLEVATTPIDCP